jgi:hypothetical protein
VATDDGSLRNGGVELVSIPLLFDEVEAAVVEVETIIQESGAIASSRCGLHTHMNMRPYSVGQVWSLATLYGILEPSLYLGYAVGREDSTFAVPLWLNTRQVRALSNDLANVRRTRSDLLPHPECLSTCKYSALNFGALSRFGTLEMRQPYCSTDFEAIRSWLDFCVRLIEIGTSFEDPCEVIDYYERTSLTGVQERMFGTTMEVSPDIQELADDAAYLIAGFEEPEWQELEWDNPILEAV